MQKVLINNREIVEETGVLASYPIGSLYFNGLNDKCPGEIFGGSWVKIKDCFLWATGDIQSITYTKNRTTITENLTLGSKGGELTHTLTVEEMPSHTHELRGYRGGNIRDSYSGIGSRDDHVYRAVNDNNNGIQCTGNNKSHNNMSPYLAVNVWQRIN